LFLSQWAWCAFFVIVDTSVSLGEPGGLEVGVCISCAVAHLMLVIMDVEFLVSMDACLRVAQLARSS